MLRQIVSGAVLVVDLVVSRVTWAETPTASTQVQVSLDALNRYVRNDANGQNWKRFLLSKQLAAELAKGDAADRDVLAAVLAKYSGREKGLDLPQFVAVKTALAAWIAELQQPAPEQPVQPTQQPANLAAAAREAKASFAPVNLQKAMQAKVELASAVRELERWLRRSGAGRAEGWKKYLGWNDLVNVVAQEGPPDANVVGKLIG